jgi:Fe-S-cluster containining protein
VPGGQWDLPAQQLIDSAAGTKLTIVDRNGKFSYACNTCGLCCRDKVITLSPYDVIRIARTGGISTSQAVALYTIRRGSLLRFSLVGRCVALDGTSCRIHSGRPLACRLYPLGLERLPLAGPVSCVERFVQLEPTAGSSGVYGSSGTVEEFLEAQGTARYLAAVALYHPLVAAFGARVAALVDFEHTEPREFWRRAAREALAETGFDANPLIDALYDPDGLGCGRSSAEETAAGHVVLLAGLAARERDGARLAAAAAMLAIGLGYAPDEARRAIA